MRQPSRFSSTAFQNFILEHQAIGLFEKPIKLVSGRMSSWYVNWRTVSNDVSLMDQLSDFLLDFCADHRLDFNCFLGTPDGATKLAVLSQFKWAKSRPDFAPGKYVLPMGRKQPKEHGEPKDRFFTGAPQGKIIVLEDVTTTGGSLLQTVQRLIDLDYNVTAAIALTNRNEVMDDGRHVSATLEELKVQYLALSEGLALLPLLHERQPFSDTIKQSIEAEFAEFGQQPLKFEA